MEARQGREALLDAVPSQQHHGFVDHPGRRPGEDRLAEAQEDAEVEGLLAASVVRSLSPGLLPRVDESEDRGQGPLLGAADLVQGLGHQGVFVEGMTEGPPESGVGVDDAAGPAEGRGGNEDAVEAGGDEDVADQIGETPVQGAHRVGPGAMEGDFGGGELPGAQLVLQPIHRVAVAAPLSGEAGRHEEEPHR